MSFTCDETEDEFEANTVAYLEALKNAVCGVEIGEVDGEPIIDAIALIRALVCLASIAIIDIEDLELKLAACKASLVTVAFAGGDHFVNELAESGEATISGFTRPLQRNHYH